MTLPGTAVSIFGGEAESFPSSAMQVESNARDVCMLLGNNKPLGPDGAGMSVMVLRDYLAPDATDGVYQDVMGFLHFQRTTQTVGEYWVKFHLLRRKADGHTQPGGTYCVAFVAVLC